MRLMIRLLAPCLGALLAACEGAPPKGAPPLGTLPGHELPSEEPPEPSPLVVPAVVDAAPGPGLRVRRYLPGDEGTELYHTVYLPTDWQRGQSLPVVVEYAGNKYRRGDGSVESCKLGYGLTGGRSAIWLCLPFVDSQRRAHTPTWWGDVDATVAYCKRAVARTQVEFGGDASRTILAGFSRGAIACNFIGLHDDEIAALWRGFFCHSHYEGVRAWPGSDPAGAAARLARLGDRPQFISHEASVNATRDYLAQAAPNGDFTFRSLPFPDHTDAWVLVDSPARQALRRWFADSVGTR